MKASELKGDIYNKLVSLNYSRKENYLSEVNSINWFDLEFELREVMESFPARYIDFNVDLMGIEDLDREQQFYVFHTEGQAYLVDTQGYTYPRYIVELEGFGETNDQIDDTFLRMDGLARIADVTILEAVVKSLALEFKQEGFDKEDILNYIDSKIAVVFLNEKLV
jgi:hypothetical protein